MFLTSLFVLSPMMHLMYVTRCVPPVYPLMAWGDSAAPCFNFCFCGEPLKNSTSPEVIRQIPSARATLLHPNKLEIKYLLPRLNISSTQAPTWGSVVCSFSPSPLAEEGYLPSPQGWADSHRCLLLKKSLLHPSLKLGLAHPPWATLSSGSLRSWRRHLASLSSLCSGLCPSPCLSTGLFCATPSRFGLV